MVATRILKAPLYPMIDGAKYFIIIFIIIIILNTYTQ